MHDLQKHTALALPTFAGRLKAGGYKVVQMKAKTPLETLPEYDAMMVKDLKVPASAAKLSAACADGFGLRREARLGAWAILYRHGRARPGHPSLTFAASKNVDARGPSRA